MLLFYSRCLKFLSFSLMLYGLAMIFAPDWMNQTLVVPLLYSDKPIFQSTFNAMTGEEQQLLETLSALLGTVTLGWAIQMTWIAHIPFRKGEPWAWFALGSSLITWAILEFIFKFISGIGGLGLFAHFGLLLAYAIPLILTYPSSQRKATL